MSQYDFSLRQEVLLEKGAAVLGDLFQYQRKNHIDSPQDPVSVMFSLIWNAKQDILLADSEADLNEIEGQFNLANQFLINLEAS